VYDSRLFLQCLDAAHWERRVSFTTPDPASLPLPSPKLLSLHFAVCQIFHMSGRADYLPRFLYKSNAECCPNYFVTRTPMNEGSLSRHHRTRRVRQTRGGFLAT
jgi:hypothetical protein